MLADAGYWHGEQIDALIGQGVQVLIPPDADKRRGKRPGWDGGRYAFMRNVLETVAGGELYAQRPRMIEPIFADTKFNRRADRFLRRGSAAARSEWRLITATGNLLKLWRHTIAPLADWRPPCWDRRAVARLRRTGALRRSATPPFPQQPPWKGGAAGRAREVALRGSGPSQAVYADEDRDLGLHARLGRRRVTGPPRR